VARSRPGPASAARQLDVCPVPNQS
jgi:hypothetical protein